MAQKSIRIELVSPATGYLEVKDNFSVPLTFNVADIRDVSKKKGTTSKSIKLAGTKNNHKVLNNYFDANVVTGVFDYNKLQKCNVIEDGQIILPNAYIQLVSINNNPNTPNWNGEIEYTALIKDDVATFFTTIDGKLLTDLSYGEFNHFFTAANIISTMSNTFADGYKYHFNTNGGSMDYTLDQFAPEIFAKTYLDKIFEAAGYTYEWDVFSADTVQFDKVIVPYNGKPYQPSEPNTQQYEVEAQLTAFTQYTSGQTGGNLVGFYDKIYLDDELFDQSNFYTPSASTYLNTFFVNNNAGNTLNVRLAVQYRLILENNGPSTAYIVNDLSPNTQNTAVGWNVTPRVRTINETSSGVSPSTQNLAPQFPIATTDFFGTITNYSIPTGDTVISSGFSVTTPSVTFASPNDILSWEIGVGTSIIGNIPQGKIPHWRLGTGNTDTLADVQMRIEVDSAQLTVVPSLSNQAYNTVVDMNAYIPAKIKQSDFVVSILSLYNIYIEIDPTQPNNLIFRHRDEYYDSGANKNWSRKLVKGLGTELQLLPELANKKLLLTYKHDDKDSALKVYKEATNEVYGQVEYTFDSEYVKGEQKKELIFSPIVSIEDNNQHVLPALTSGPGNNIKIALNAVSLEANQPFTITNYPTNSETTQLYPLVHHWNSPKNASFDLNFALCDYYFYQNTGGFTNNNMYNLHWRRTVNQINEGKMLTAFFNLDSTDIYNLELNDKITINNTVWNINKIIDYQAGTDKPTKVELISIDDSIKLAPFKTKKPVRPFSIAPVLEILQEPDFPGNDNGNGGSGGNVIVAPMTDVKGDGNFVGGSGGGSTVYGNDNKVYNKSQVYGDDNVVNGNKAFVIGDDNVIEEGASNTFIVGDNITADTSNTLFADNITVVSNLTLSSGSTFVISGGTITGLDYLPLSGGTMDSGAAITSFSSTAATDSFAFGQNNLSSGSLSFIGGGDGNTASGVRSTIGGGSLNVASNTDSTIAGGRSNTASGMRSFVGGGVSNTASGNRSMVLGGNANTASNTYSAVVGGNANGASGMNSTIAGGNTNTMSGANSFMGGGSGNDVTGLYSSIIGGYVNKTNGAYSSSVIGGSFNYNYGNKSSIVGGQNNNIAVYSYSSTILGGQQNILYGSYIGIIGGLSNDATGFGTGIIGGYNNTVSGNNTVVIGGQNITGSIDNTVYVPNLNIGIIGSGTSINNLGYDASGNVVSGTTGGSAFTGGTVTGETSFTADVNLLGVGAGTIAGNLGLDSTGTIVSGTTSEIGIINSGSSESFIIKKFVIGGWNMDATTSGTIDSGIPNAKITTAIVMDVTIVDDGLTVYSPLNTPTFGSTATFAGGWHMVAGASNIQVVVSRVAGTSYDSTSYDDGTINRGWITVMYKA